MPVTDVKARCSACFKQFEERDTLRACGNCRVVRYCSRACQRLAWQDHKKICSSQLQDLKKTDPRGKTTKMNDKFTKFTNAWRDAWSCFALWALNEPGQPHGHLQRRVFLVILEENDNATSHLDAFRVKTAAINTREATASIMLNSGISPDNVSRWKADIRNAQTIHSVTMLGSLVKPMCIGAADPVTGEGYNHMDSVPPPIASALAKEWHFIFCEAVRLGQPRLAAEYPSIAAQKAGLDMKQADDSMHDFPPFQYCEQAAMEALQQHGTFLGRMYPNATSRAPQNVPQIENGEPGEPEAESSQAPKPLTKGQKKNKRIKARKEAAALENLVEDLPSLQDVD